MDTSSTSDFLSEKRSAGKQTVRTNHNKRYYDDRFVRGRYARTTRNRNLPLRQRASDLRSMERQIWEVDTLSEFPRLIGDCVTLSSCLHALIQSMNSSLLKSRRTSSPALQRE